jgi:hypothetical protein
MNTKIFWIVFRSKHHNKFDVTMRWCCCVFAMAHVRTWALTLWRIQSNRFDKATTVELCFTLHYITTWQYFSFHLQQKSSAFQHSAHPDHRRKVERAWIDVSIDITAVIWLSFIMLYLCIASFLAYSQRSHAWCLTLDRKYASTLRTIAYAGSVTLSEFRIT